MVIPSECQTVWIQIRPNIVISVLGPNCLQMLADDTNSQKVNRLQVRSHGGVLDNSLACKPGVVFLLKSEISKSKAQEI